MLLIRPAIALASFPVGVGVCASTFQSFRSFCSGLEGVSIDWIADYVVVVVAVVAYVDVVPSACLAVDTCVNVRRQQTFGFHLLGSDDHKIPLNAGCTIHSNDSD